MADDVAPLSDADDLRRPEPISLDGIELQPVAGAEPVFMEISLDCDLLVINAKYQRNIGERGERQIRRIAASFDRRRAGPPVVAYRADGKLEIIDGQHTVIAALSRGDIKSLMFKVIDAAEVTERASAFVALNRDRLSMTQSQLHAAAVTAGDAEALKIEAVCSAVGVQLLRANPPKWNIGESVAVLAIGALIKRVGDEQASRILKIMVDGESAPVSANGIKAVELLLTDPEYDGVVDSSLAWAIRSTSDTSDHDARVFAATHCVPHWRGLAATWFKKMPKPRRKAA